MVQELPRIAVGAGNGEDQVVEMVSTSGGEHHALPTAACYMFIYPCILYTDRATTGKTLHDHAVAHVR